MALQTIDSAKSDAENDDPAVHEGFMREALAMAHLALATDETPVGCVLVHQGHIISRGMNATKRSMNGTRHAEFEAISNLLSNPQPQFQSQSQSQSHPHHSPSDLPPPPASILQETILYVTIEPCIMCASLLRQYQIPKVYFGAANERFGGTGGVLNVHSDPGVERGFEASGGWLRAEAILLLRRFYVGENRDAPKPRKKADRRLNLVVEPADSMGI